MEYLTSEDTQLESREKKQEKNPKLAYFSRFHLRVTCKKILIFFTLEQKN